MSRPSPSPIYTERARSTGVGVRDAGLADAYFVDVDGVLEVTTDPAEATHSLVEHPDGTHYEIAPYRSDATMILGDSQTQLAPVRVPEDSFPLFWVPRIEGLIQHTRPSPAGYVDSDGGLQTAADDEARSAHYYEDGN